MTQAGFTSLFLLICTGFLPAPAPAQQTMAPGDTTARIQGTVRSSFNGLPITGVMFTLRRAPGFGVSDSTGAFALDSVPGGRQTLRILYRDSLWYEQPIELKPGATLVLSVLLAVDAVELTPIVVEVTSQSAERSLAGFYERRKGGFGRFFTLADLQRRRPTSMSGLLSEAGVAVRCFRSGACIPLAPNGLGQCVMELYLDGTPFPSDMLEAQRPDELAAVEVYRRALDVPLQFQSGSASGCGVVLLWRRH